MPSYIAFDNPDGTQTLIEVASAEGIPTPGAPVKASLSGMVGDAVRFATTSLQDALASAIRSNAQALYCGIENLSPRPTDVEITFALKATLEVGNVAVSKVGGEANFNVKLCWKQPPTKPQTEKT